MYDGGIKKIIDASGSNQSTDDLVPKVTILTSFLFCIFSDMQQFQCKAFFYFICSGDSPCWFSWLLADFGQTIARDKSFQLYRRLQIPILENLKTKKIFFPVLIFGFKSVAALPTANNLSLQVIIITDLTRVDDLAR